jgi:hypothetical protein
MSWLHGRAVSDAVDFKICAEARGNTGDKVAHHGARCAPHIAGAAGLGAGRDGNLALAHLHRDVVHQRDRALAKLALGGKRLAIEFDFDALRHRHGVFSDT